MVSYTPVWETEDFLLGSSLGFLLRLSLIPAVCIPFASSSWFSSV